MIPSDMPAAFLELEAAYNAETGYFGKDGDGQDGIHTEMPVCRMWYWLARMIGARNVLETGTYRGYSTCLLAAAVRDNGGGRVTTVDPWQIPHLWDGTSLETFIRWIPKPSQQAFADVCGERYDILIVDSIHTYGQSSWELAQFEPLVRPGGVILMHDSLFHDGVGCAAAQLCASDRFESVTFDTPRKLQTEHIQEPVSMGLTIIRKKADGPALQPIAQLIDMPEHTPDGPQPVLRQGKISQYRSVQLTQPR